MENRVTGTIASCFPNRFLINKYLNLLWPTIGKNKYTEKEKQNISPKKVWVERLEESFITSNLVCRTYF